MKEEAEPRALPSSLMSHPVHAVVPVAASHEGKTVGARRQPFVDGTKAMLEERALFRGDPWVEVGLLCFRSEERSLQVRNALLQNPGVSRRPDVVGRRVRKPQQIVGAAGARAAAARLVPPMLYVPLDELPARRSQQMLPHELRSGEWKGHCLLQLVAESEG